MNRIKQILIVFISLFLICKCDLHEPEQEEPEISIKSPLNNSYVYETVSITAEASDNKGIVYVEFYIDGKTDSSMMDMISPYSYDWNTLNLPDSSIHTIFAKAADTDDNISSSEMINVTVNNNLAIPEPVTIESPATVTDSSVTLKWSENTNEDFKYFSIFRDTTTGVDFNSNHIATIYEDTVVQYTDFNVLENISYNYVIYIFDDYNFYSKSNEVSANIPNRKPEPITLYNPTNITDSTMTIMWSTSQIHDFQKYCLYRSLSDNPDNTSNVVFETSDKYENLFTDTELETNTVYFYRLGIYDTGDLFSLSNIVSDTAKAQVWTVPTEGLVAYYPFNGNANDESGNSYNGSISGAILTTDRFESENCSYSFDGINDRISLPFDAGIFTEGLTISAWFLKTKSTPFGENQGIVVNDGGGTIGRGVTLFCSDGCIGFQVANENDISIGAGKHMSISTTKWYHVVGICDYSKISFYVDNVLSESNDFSSSAFYDNNVNFQIGYDTYGNEAHRYFGGKIDDVRIFDRALSESEIQALHNEGGWEK